MEIKMVSILPPSIKEQRKLRSEIIKFLSMTGLISVILLLSGIIVLKYRIYIESELSYISETSKLLEAEIEANRKELEVIEKKQKLKKIVENAMGKIPDWEMTIEEIVSIMPNEFYIEDIEAISHEENFVTIRGKVNYQKAINKFIYKLNRMESVKNVEIIYINKLPMEDGAMTEFAVKIYISGAPYQLKIARKV